MNYTTPTNEDKKLERKQQDLDSNLSFQDTKLDSFSDLPNESPIAFDKFAFRRIRSKLRVG